MCARLLLPIGLAKAVSMFTRIAQLVKQHALHIRNVTYFLGTRAFAIVAFVLVVPFFIRQASEEQYGLVAIGFSLLTIATALDVAFGYVVTQSSGRRFARGRNSVSETFHGLCSLYLVLATGLALCGLVTVFALHLSEAETLMYGSFAAMLPALCVSGVVAAVLQSRNQLALINVSRLGFELAKALALTLSALLAKDISLVGPILLIAAYCRVALDIHYFTKLTGIRLRFHGTGAHLFRYWRLARFGAPSFGMVALMLPISIGDKLIIKNTFGTDAVAYYSIAFDINAKAYLLVNAVNAAMFTIVLQRFTRKSSTFAPIAAGLITVTLLAGMYYLPLIVFTPYILTQWVGAEFSASAESLTRIMVFASLIYLYGNVFENALTAMGRARHLFIVYLTATFFYGAAIALSVWEHSLNGFMFSYLILCAVLFAGFFLQYYRATNILFKRIRYE